jgi:hypothetical protein
MAILASAPSLRKQRHPELTPVLLILLFYTIIQRHPEPTLILLILLFSTITQLHPGLTPVLLILLFSVLCTTVLNRLEHKFCSTQPIPPLKVPFQTMLDTNLELP